MELALEPIEPNEPMGGMCGCRVAPVEHRAVKPEKQRARIENWRVVPTLTAEKRYLVGQVQDHPRQDEFHAPYQMTSQLVYLDLNRGEAETLNTIYILGDAMPSEEGELF